MVFKLGELKYFGIRKMLTWDLINYARTSARLGDGGASCLTFVKKEKRLRGENDSQRSIRCKNFAEEMKPKSRPFPVPSYRTVNLAKKCVQME